jgi:hypothetical protein
MLDNFCHGRMVVAFATAMPKTSQDADAGKATRLSLPLDSDGFIDLSSMRTSSLEKLDNIIANDPNVRQRLDELSGKTDPDAADVFGGITQENVSKGLDMIQAINAGVLRIAAAKLVKHPLLRDQHGKPVPFVFDQDVLDKTFAFTPEQHKELDPRATRLAEKYSGKMPEWLKQNLDLYLFCSMFLAYTAQNAKAVMELQIKRDVARIRDEYTRSAAAQPKNPQPDSDVVRTQPVNGHDRSEARQPMPEPIETATAPPPEAPTV